VSKIVIPNLKPQILHLQAVAAKTAAEAERLRRDAEAARLKRQHEEEERRKKEKAEEETHRRQCENELKKQQEESLRARMAAADAALGFYFLKFQRYKPLFVSLI